jgi:hypothetical protein
MAIQVNTVTVIGNDRTVYNTGNVGINTNSVTTAALVGAGSSFSGLYVCNGMIQNDTILSGNQFVGATYNGLMSGPVTITGVLTVNGNFVVV